MAPLATLILPPAFTQVHRVRGPVRPVLALHIDLGAAALATWRRWCRRNRWSLGRLSSEQPTRRPVAASIRSRPPERDSTHIVSPSFARRPCGAVVREVHPWRIATIPKLRCGYGVDMPDEQHQSRRGAVFFPRRRGGSGRCGTAPHAPAPARRTPVTAPTGVLPSSRCAKSRTPYGTALGSAERAHETPEVVRWPSSTRRGAAAADRPGADPRVHEVRRLTVRSFTVRRASGEVGAQAIPVRPGRSVATVADRWSVCTPPTRDAVPVLWARVPGFRRDIWGPRCTRRALCGRWRCGARCGCDDSALPRSGRRQTGGGHQTRRLIRRCGEAGVADDGAAWLTAARAAVLAYLDGTGGRAAYLRAAVPELAGTYDPAPGKPGAARHTWHAGADGATCRGDIVRGRNHGGWVSSRPLWASTGRGWVSAERNRRGRGRAGSGPGCGVRTGDVTTSSCVRPHPDLGPSRLAEIGAVAVDLDALPLWRYADDLGTEPNPNPTRGCCPAPGLDVTTMAGPSGMYLNGLREQSSTTAQCGPTAWWTAGWSAAGVREDGRWRSCVQMSAAMRGSPCNARR
jgi:hypothetical protein